MDDFHLGGAVVGVAIPGAGEGGAFPIGGAVGPAVGGVVADVEVVVIAIGARWVASKIGAFLAGDVAFLAGDDVGAKAGVSPVSESGDEALAVHGGWSGDSGGIEEGGGEVDEGSEV